MDTIGKKYILKLDIYIYIFIYVLNIYIYLHIFYIFIYMIFTNRAINVDTKLKINCTEIERVSGIKFLGLLIEERLSWKPHIDNIRAKLAKFLAALNRKTCFVLFAALHDALCRSGETPIKLI